ncbi:hypothetical protein K1567_01105 [Pseudomonas sp. S5F11]|uniref:hypothetical protein n=1 Tax=Pseudomonas sp. S5F11 TaxID=2866385 RepID=UPI001C7CCF2F|nr:hypothetical protein [Pseudomonas sp. S5F11]MBX4134520.1 hypothetical protein [Pseudomonas sp. S5F11]
MTVNARVSSVRISQRSRSICVSNCAPNAPPRCEQRWPGDGGRATVAATAVVQLLAILSFYRNSSTRKRK